MTKNKTLDVAIIGGGSAGMSAALVFGRAMMHAIIINDEKPRNLVTQGSHGFLTRDGVHPSELLQVAKTQLLKYTTVNYVKGQAANIEKQAAGFEITAQNGEVFHAQNVVFATGYKDDISTINLPGIKAVYGKTVYPCPFCDGWERRNQPLALFGEEVFVAQFAKTIHHWSKDLIVFTNGKKVVSEEDKKALERNNIRLIEGEIQELISENGQLSGVKLASGELIARTGGFLLSTGEKQATGIPAKLGVETTDFGTYKTNDWGKSAVEGIYIVGDAKNGFSGIAAAVAEGSMVAEMMIHEIINERWEK